MDRHAQIDVFSQAAHRLAVIRLREKPARLVEALGVIERWRQTPATVSHCAPYLDEWEALLRGGVDAVELAACATTDHGATLRSVSPLGRFITAAERSDLLKQARQAA